MELEKQSEASRKIEVFPAEAEKSREEADGHRKTAERYVAEAEKYKSE